MKKMFSTPKVILATLLVAAGTVTLSHALTPSEKKDAVEATEIKSIAKESNTTPLKSNFSAFEAKVALQLPRLFGGQNHAPISSVVKNEDSGLFSVFLANGDHILFEEDAETAVISSRGVMSVINLVKGTNLTDEERKRQVKTLISKFEPMYTIPAKGEEVGRIYVAKDPQCGYCNKLEGEVPALVEAGIAVEMYPLPVFPGSAQAMQIAACSANPKKTYEDIAANIRSLRGQVENKAQEMGVQLVDRTSEEAVFNEVIEEYFATKGFEIDTCDYPTLEIGAAFNASGLSGTPAIYTSNDVLIRGYVPAQRIIDMFK